MRKKLYCYSRSDILLPETLMEIITDPNPVVVSISSSTDTPLTSETFGLSSDKFISLSFDDLSECENCPPLHAMTEEEAMLLYNFIESNLDNNFYVHCDAGKSRSQAVVRYILDMYGGEEEWEIRKENPCLTLNYHVLGNLKRANYKSNHIMGYL